jgi:hypothetical protein
MGPEVGTVQINKLKQRTISHSGGQNPIFRIFRGFLKVTQPVVGKEKCD